MQGITPDYLNAVNSSSDKQEAIQGINSDCIDLIYLDPPFNKKKVFTAPIGSNADGASFKDIFREEDIKEEWIDAIKGNKKYKELSTFLECVKVMEGGLSYNYCYLTYMAIRLIAMKRVLKDTGSIYLHCDQTMSHYLKLLLDCIFGEKNFRNEIIWRYGKMQNASKNYPRNNDCILFYTKSDNYTFNVLKGAESEYKERWKKYIRNNKIFYGNVKHKKDKMLMGRIKKIGETESLNDNTVLYDFDKEYKALDNNWYISIIKGNDKQRTGYPTQKPLTLLERIIEASSNKGDVVLDPFCGCATTCVAAEKLHRRWIGIDVSIKAYELVKERLEKEVADPEDLFKFSNIINFKTDPPERTDQGGYDDVDKSYVYIAVNDDNVKLKDWFKVGVSINPENRIKTAFDPFGSTRIIHKVLKENYRETERHIHNKHESNGEWVTGVGFDTLKKEIDEYVGKEPDQ